jgi:UDP-N-acetyl-D-glucosamine dehydrogenase
LKGSRILLLGLSYKAEVDDMRESPTFVLMDLLTQGGAEVAYHDPFIPVIRPTREHGHWTGKKSVRWDKKTVSGFDAVLISTAHKSVNYTELARWSPLIVDTRNAMASIKTRANQVWKA